MDRTRPAAAETFLVHRRRQEAAHKGKAKWSEDVMVSLISVEVNIIDGCNRTCSFCPHASEKVYPNHYDWKMTRQITHALGAQLANFDYKGRISMSGYGEPMLNRVVADHIAIFRHHLPDNPIELNTNGDPLTVDNIQRVFNAGLTQMYINLYDDKDQALEFIELFRKTGVHEFVLRPHYDKDDSYGLIINNRSGIVRPRNNAMEKRCHYPFYKLFIDWNGDALFCANDWGRNLIIGNIMETPIDEIWMCDKMKEIRLNLAEGDRSMHPCAQCNVNGTLHGDFSFKRLMDHYAK